MDGKVKRDNLRVTFAGGRGRGPSPHDEANLAELRSFSTRLADILRPHWPGIGTDYVPVELRWPDEHAGRYVEIMQEGGSDIHEMTDAAEAIRRLYVEHLDGLIAVRAEEAGSLEELEQLRRQIALLSPHEEDQAVPQV